MRRLTIVLALMLSSCGGGGSGPTTPTAPVPTPTPTPSKANIQFGFQNNTWTITEVTQIAGDTLKCGDFRADAVFGETAGLAATLKKTDAYLREADGDIEGRVVNDDRNDRLPARGTITLGFERFACGYKRDLPITLIAAFTFIDDKNNVIELQGQTEFVER